MMEVKMGKTKNKYIKWLWNSFLSQLTLLIIIFVLDINWLLIPLIFGIIFNYFLNRKADKEQERIVTEVGE